MDAGLFDIGKFVFTEITHKKMSTGTYLESLVVYHTYIFLLCDSATFYWLHFPTALCIEVTFTIYKASDLSTHSSVILRRSQFVLYSPDCTRIRQESCVQLSSSRCSCNIFSPPTYASVHNFLQLWLMLLYYFIFVCTHV